MKIVMTLYCLLTLWGCTTSQNNTSTDKSLAKQDSMAAIRDSLPQVYISRIRAGDTLIKGKTYTDTISFISYDDNGDDAIIVGVKNRDTVALIFNTANTPPLNNGDQILVQWNMDMYAPAGDPDFPYPREFAVDYRLLHAGNVTMLKKKGPKLRALYHNPELSETGKTAIEAAVWFYVANTTDSTIRNFIDVEQKPLQYIVDEQQEQDNGNTIITFSTDDQQVLKRLFFNAEKPYSLFE